MSNSFTLATFSVSISADVLLNGAVIDNDTDADADSVPAPAPKFIS